MNFVARVIERIEAKRVGVATFFATLLAIITVRNFLENILEASHAVGLGARFYLQTSDFCHIALSWATVFFTLVLVLRLFSGTQVLSVAKAVLALFPLIVVVPLLDFFLFGSGAITYQSDFDSFWFSYLHLFDPRVPISYVTDGVRVEIFLAVLFSFLYLYNATAALVRSALGALSIYSAIYFYGYLPAIYNGLFSTSAEEAINRSILFSRSPIQLNFLLYVPVALFLCASLFGLLRPEVRRGIMVSLRIERLAIYLSLMFFGVAVSAVNGLIFEDLFNLYDLLKLGAAALSLGCAFVFSTMLNDIGDYEIDRISNRGRPLVRGDIEPQAFAGIKTVMLVLSLFLAVPLNEYFVFILIFIISLSYLYSCDPFRLKRVFLLSHLLLAMIGVSVFLLGTCLVDGRLAFSSADGKLLGLIFGFFFIASHLKDIKDGEGDRACGVVTLTTLVGGRWAYRIVSGLVSVAIVAAGLLLELNAVLVAGNLAVFVIAAVWFKNSEKLLLALQCCVAAIFIGYAHLLL